MPESSDLDSLDIDGSRRFLTFAPHHPVRKRFLERLQSLLFATQEPEKLPPLADHETLNDLFQDIQERAQQSPYPYIAGSVRTL